MSLLQVILLAAGVYIVLGVVVVFVLTRLIDRASRQKRAALEGEEAEHGCHRRAS